jgi:hypothetical protein
VNQTEFYVSPGPISTSVSTLVLSSQSGVVAGESFAGLKPVCCSIWL